MVNEQYQYKKTQFKIQNLIFKAKDSYYLFNGTKYYIFSLSNKLCNSKIKIQDGNISIYEILLLNKN